MPGLYLLMYIERVPKDSTSLVNAVSMPLMIEAISITVTTPMITPMMVRNERILLARKVASASQRFSRISERNIFIRDSCPQNLRLSLRTKRFNRIQTSRFPGRDNSGNDPHASRGCQGAENRKD